jgi:hypothetical protein
LRLRCHNVRARACAWSRAGSQHKTLLSMCRTSSCAGRLGFLLHFLKLFWIFTRSAFQLLPTIFCEVVVCTWNLNLFIKVWSIPLNWAIVLDSVGYRFFACIFEHSAFCGVSHGFPTCNVTGLLYSHGVWFFGNRTDAGFSAPQSFKLFCGLH